MSDFVAITFSGLALGAIYFLVASGLSLIYGLMGVLNFAHGAYLTVGAYAAWLIATSTPAAWGLPARFAIGVVAGVAVGAVVGGLTEVLLIRPLYGRHVAQILVTVGLDLVLGALIMGGFGGNSQTLPVPGWLTSAARLGPELLPHSEFVAIGAGLAVLMGLAWFLRHTRYGLIVRAGVENREMVQALGIDVGRAFTLIFLLGGALAGLAGVLNAVVFSGSLVFPTQGDQLLIFAFIVVVIGGLGSLSGSAVAAVLVGLVQDYVNFYAGNQAGLAELGNLSVVLLLAVILQLRPQGLFGQRVLFP